MSDAHEPDATDAPSGVAPEATAEGTAEVTAQITVDDGSGNVAAPDAASGAASLDLDAIERELADVESALARLDGGTYWTDEVTGGPIPDEQLAADPIARRAAPALDR